VCVCVLKKQKNYKIITACIKIPWFLSLSSKKIHTLFMWFDSEKHKHLNS